MVPLRWTALRGSGRDSPPLPQTIELSFVLVRSTVDWAHKTPINLFLPLRHCLSKHASPSFVVLLKASMIPGQACSPLPLLPGQYFTGSLLQSGAMSCATPGA